MSAVFALYDFLFCFRCPPGHMTKETSQGKVCVYTLCASRPCRHGTCVAHSPSRYSCHCSKGYRGRHCEVTLAMFHNEDNSLSLSSMFAISICVMAFLGSYVDYVLFYLWWLSDVSISHPCAFAALILHLDLIASPCNMVVFHSFASVISSIVTILISGVEAECDFCMGGGRDMKPISPDAEREWKFYRLS